MHALNEIVERDAMSLLLIGQFLTRFLTRSPLPLVITDPHTLPSDLAALLDFTRAHTGGEVHLIDMSTDIGVPAYWAYLQQAEADFDRSRSTCPQPERSAGWQLRYVALAANRRRGPSTR